MIGRVLFFVESPWNLRDQARFGIEILRAADLEPAYWDFTPWLHPYAVSPVDAPFWEGCRRFGSEADAVGAVRTLGPDTLVIALVPYRLNTYSLYRALSKTSAPIATITDSQPSPQRTVASRKVLSKLAPKRLPSAIFKRIPPSVLGIRSASLVLAAGRRSIPTHVPVGKRSETLWIHALDYDLYLAASSGGGETDPKLCVFLDEFQPFHPDYEKLGVGPSVTPDCYFGALRAFFDRVEDQLAVRVVVAAHPRSDYDRRPDYFGGREVVRGKTVDLVRRAAFIIAQTSTALNFAVLYRKPVVFVTSDELQRSFAGPFVSLMAQLLGKTPHSLDHPSPIDWNFELRVNQECYDAFLRNHIKREGTPELPFWRVLADRLRERDLSSCST